MRIRWTIAAAWLALNCFVPSFLCARVEIKPGFNTFSTQQDIDLGQQAAQQVQKQYPMVSDLDLDGYINRLGKKLSGYAPGYKFPYQFHLVNAKQINAFALPGGQVYVHTATVLAATSEAQLAGVMAHEISHVALRHSTNQASKAMLAQAPLAILGGVLSGGGLGGQLAQLGIAFGVNSAFLKFSRSAEREADELGAQIMYDAGFAPRAMAELFQTIEKQGGNQSLEFLSDHPNPGNRVADVDRLIPRLGPSRGFAADNSEFERFKRRVAGLQASGPAVGGEAALAGRNDRIQPPAPSPRFRALNASFFSVSYPDNWKISGQDTDTITVVPPGGVVSSNDGSLPAIAYGMVASIYQPLTESGRRMTLADATNQLVSELVHSNPHIHVISEAAVNRRIGGQEAFSVTALGRSPIGSESEMNWIVTSYRPEGLWYVIFIAPEPDWNRYQPVFDQILSSVRFPR